MGVGDQRKTPAALPPGKTQYPLSRSLGGPQSQSGQVRKISPPLEFDPQTIQPVASRYTAYAIQSRIYCLCLSEVYMFLSFEACYITYAQSQRKFLKESVSHNQLLSEIEMMKHTFKKSY